MSVQTFVLALGAAIFYATTSVLQQSAASTVPHERSMRPSLLIELLRRPRWVFGTVAESGAVALQFLALRHGSLLAVQVLLVSGLLFALPLAAAMHRQWLGPSDWLGAVAVVSGLSVFIGVAAPSAGRAVTPSATWAAVLGIGLAVVALLIVAGPRQPGPARATCLGAACGVLFGLDAALFQATGHLLDRGLAHAVTSWQPYVLLGLAAFGFVVSQSAFQAGPLSASLPVMTIADPIVAAVIGTIAFQERVAAGPAALGIEAMAIAAMAAGVFLLARSPLVTGEMASAKRAP